MTTALATRMSAIALLCGLFHDIGDSALANLLNGRTREGSHGRRRDQTRDVIAAKLGRSLTPDELTALDDQYYVSWLTVYSRIRRFRATIVKSIRDLEPGDKVLIFSKRDDLEDTKGFNTCWLPDMTKVVGTVATVQSVGEPDYGPLLCSDVFRAHYHFPVQALAKVKG